MADAGLGLQDPMLSGFDQIRFDEDDGMGNSFFVGAHGRDPTYNTPFYSTSPHSASFDSTAINGIMEFQPCADEPLYMSESNVSESWPHSYPFQTQPVFEGTTNTPESPTPHYEREVSPDPFQLSQPEVIPQQVLDLAAHINSLPKCRSGEYDDNVLPYRQTLKTDPVLRGEVSKKTGCLCLERRGGKLRKWLGDNRLFTDEMWEYLTSPDYMRVKEGVRGIRKRNISAAGEFQFVTVVPPSPSLTPSPTQATKKRRAASTIENSKRKHARSNGQEDVGNPEVLAACDKSELPPAQECGEASNTEEDQAIAPDDSTVAELSTAYAKNATTEGASGSFTFSIETTDLMSMLNKDFPEV